MSIKQKSGRQTFRRRFVSGSLFVLPCPPECNFQSETKIEPDLRLFVSLPTGHGKSLIYQLAPSVSKHLGLLSEVPIVLVISPLNALIDDQIASVTKLGITACKLDASSLEDTVSLAGHEILFTNPKMLETGGARK